MSRSWGVVLSSLAALAPLPALGQEAQPSTPPGSLTVLSRPTGASIRITGDRLVIGRTPLTLERGLTGRYRVRSLEPGYETWRRTILLDGASADTLWMTLRRKTALKAAVRSLLVPGWGQFYSGRNGAGWMYLLGAGGAGGALLATHLEYEDRVDELNAAVGVDERRRAAERAEEAYDQRQVLGIVTAALWGIGVIDAAAFLPRVPVGTVKVGWGGPAAGQPGIRMQVSF